MTVKELIEQLQKLPQDAIIIHQDYDTADFFTISGFIDDPIMMMKYVEDVRGTNPLNDWSHYEEGGDIVCVRIDL